VAALVRDTQLTGDHLAGPERIERRPVASVVRAAPGFEGRRSHGELVEFVEHPFQAVSAPSLRALAGAAVAADDDVLERQLSDPVSDQLTPGSGLVAPVQLALTLSRRLDIASRAGCSIARQQTLAART
jgi:hypothetical protein